MDTRRDIEVNLLNSLYQNSDRFRQALVKANIEESRVQALSKYGQHIKGKVV